MSKRLTWAVIVLISAAALAWWLSAPNGVPAPAIENAVFRPGGVSLLLGAEACLERLRIVEQGSGLVADVRLNGVKRQKVFAALAWRPGADYDLFLRTDRGWLSFGAQAPTLAESSMQVELLAPYDSGAAEMLQPGAASKSHGAVIAAGDYTTCALILRSGIQRQALLQGSLTLDAPAEFDQTNLPPDVALRGQAGRWVMSFTRRFSGVGDVHALVFRVRAPLGAASLLGARLTLSHGGKPQHYQRQIRLKAMDAAQMATRIKVLADSLPASAIGLVDSRATAQTLYFRPPMFVTLTRWLGLGEAVKMYWQPYSYQSIVLRNDSRDTVSLLINAKTVSADSDRTPAAFYPPDLFTGTMKDMSVVVSASLLPGERARVAVPIFISSTPMPGQYRRQVTIKPMAGSKPIMVLESPLHIRTMNWRALFFTLAALVTAAIGFAVLAWKFRGILAGLKIRWVVIIALFGSLNFVGVNLPIMVFGAMIQGLLGPFSGLITGLFSDLLYFALTVTLIRLIPRPGVVALSSLVRYLLAAIIAGGFQITDLVYLGTAIAVKESALYLAGVTRKKEEFVWNWPNMCLLAALLALGDAFLNATSIYIHMVVFRLYFADWYIALNVVVNGLIYTTMAVLLGKRFSDRLVWAED